MNEEQKTWSIYTLSEPRTGAIRYVGATSQKPTQRLHGHKVSAKTRNSSPTHKWINSLLDEGLEPIMDIVDSGNVDTWEAKEKHWIQSYKDAGCDLLNQTDGGIHCEYSDEYRKKKSGESHPMYGKTRNEHSKRMSGENNPIYGRYGKDNPKIKPVIQYDKQGVFVQYWDGIIIASRELEISPSKIGDCCRYNRNTAGGFIWRYADDPIPQTEQPSLFQNSEDK